jgi:hypothetical protein
MAYMRVKIEPLDEKIPAQRAGIGSAVFSSRLSWGNAGAYRVRERLTIGAPAAYRHCGGDAPGGYCVDMQ